MWCGLYLREVGYIGEAVRMEILFSFKGKGGGRSMTLSGCVPNIPSYIRTRYTINKRCKLHVPLRFPDSEVASGRKRKVR